MDAVSSDILQVLFVIAIVMVALGVSTYLRQHSM
jgi:hypothetical protein